MGAIAATLAQGLAWEIAAALAQGPVRTEPEPKWAMSPARTLVVALAMKSGLRMMNPGLTLMRLDLGKLSVCAEH